MKRSVLFVISVFLLSLMCVTFIEAATAFKTCYPSKFGPADRIGNLNYITSKKTREASKLIKTGKSYRLAIETNKNTPAFAPRTFSIEIQQPGAQPLGATNTTYNDDIITTGWVGVGTQIDGLGHIGIGSMFYNCLNASDFVTTEGLTELGIQNLPPIATRAIILDMVDYFGIKRGNPIPEGTAFNKREILGAMKNQRIKTPIGRGDIVLFHTGWTELIGVNNTRYNNGEPGLGVKGAHYLASRGVAAVGSDSWAVEVLPAEPNAGVFQVHQILIPMNGIYILENVDTKKLVRDGVSEAFFTLGAFRVTGGVQAIINPIAIA